MRDFVGPILGFRGSSAKSWDLCILLITEGPHPSVVEWWKRPEGPEEPGPVHQETLDQLGAIGHLVAWCCDLRLPLTAQSQTFDYRIAGEEWSFEVPALGTAPHIAYTSCNGFGHLRNLKGVEDPFGCWRDLARCHQSNPFHLLLMGGDQIYADSLWELPKIKHWLECSDDDTAAPRPAPSRLLASLFSKRPSRWEQPFTASMEQEVTRFYAQLYRDRFGQPEIAALFARIPSVMMWDDHDIFDGWGSHPAKQQNSEVYQGIFGVARHAFELFQLRARGEHTLPARLPRSPGYNQLFRLGNIALLVLDLRTERTLDQVMSPESRRAIDRALETLDGCKHLVVLSSIPMLYLNLTIAEKVLAGIPGQQDLEDDLRDMWQSPRHRDERRELAHRLFTFSKDKSCRVTILSGDVHLAAHGVLRSRRPEHLDPGQESREITQLISSGIVNAPPPSLVVFAYETLAPKRDDIDDDIEGSLVKFDRRESHFIKARNWLDVSFGEAGELTATWHAENVSKENNETVTRRSTRAAQEHFSVSIP